MLRFPKSFHLLLCAWAVCVDRLPAQTGKPDPLLARTSGGNPSAPVRVALAPDGLHVAFLQEENRHLKLVIAGIDQAKPPAVAEVPHSRSAAAALQWADAEHVLVAESSAAPICFDLAGKRSATGARTPQPSSVATPPETPVASAPADLLALLDQKFPDRQVALLGADKARRRFLLLVSGGPGSARYFAFDRDDDLLFEVGRVNPP